MFMNTQADNSINSPELSGEKGWTELKIPHTYGKGRSFVTGDKSKNRIKVRYFRNESDKSFVARAWFGPATEGPAGCVHGGSMAAVLDEAMGASVWLMGYTAVAAKITIDYRKMLPLGTVTTVVAKVIAVNGRKITANGIIYDETGIVYTESEGLYINIPPERFGKMIHYRDAVQKSLRSGD